MRKAKNCKNRKSEQGMSLIAILAVMTIFAIALLAIAPSVQIEVQREKELESIRRGREIANAIRQYVVANGCTKLPNSIDDLLEGIPQGTKKKQILRPSAATDPLSEDGKWLLVKPTPQTLANFAKRVQLYNGGQLPDSPDQNCFSQYSSKIISIADTGDDADLTAPADETDLADYSTDNTEFIGVVSQSRSRSVITYYGIENHSKWIFTPLFSGAGITPTSSINNTNNTNKSQQLNDSGGGLTQQPKTK